MYLKHLSKIRKTISFRLTVWYSGFFILGSTLFFIAAYIFFSSVLKYHDHEEVSSELKELSSIYEVGGIKSFEDYVMKNYGFQKKKPLFIRIADTDNTTRRIFFPQRWQDFDLLKLENKFPVGNGAWLKLPAKKDKYVLEISSAKSSKGQWVQVGISSKDREMILTQFRRIISTIMLPLFLLGAVTGVFLSLRVLKPVRNIIQTVQSIEIGSMKKRIFRSNTGDELDELARLFNEMLDKINNLVKGMRDSLDNVAHDLRTPMTRIRNTSEIALQSDEDSKVHKEALISVVEETDRILKMLNTLMDIAEAEAGTLRIDRQLVNISTLIERVVDMYQFVAEEKNVGVRMNVPKECYAAVDPERISQAVANLLDNAIKFTPSAGVVSIEVCQTENKINIKIQDEGDGISPEELPRIWERLYRSDQSRSQKGLGLGLNLVKAIIEAHDGYVEVQSEPGKGSTFNVILSSAYNMPTQFNPVKEAGELQKGKTTNNVFL
jgi:heavy metal sensor kinase